MAPNNGPEVIQDQRLESICKSGCAYKEAPLTTNWSIPIIIEPMLASISKSKSILVDLGPASFWLVVVCTRVFCSSCISFKAGISSTCDSLFTISTKKKISFPADAREPSREKDDIFPFLGHPLDSFSPHGLRCLDNFAAHETEGQKILLGYPTLVLWIRGRPLEVSLLLFVVLLVSKKTHNGVPW